MLVFKLTNEGNSEDLERNLESYEIKNGAVTKSCERKRANLLEKKKQFLAEEKQKMAIALKKAEDEDKGILPEDKETIQLILQLSQPKPLIRPESKEKGNSLRKRRRTAAGIGKSIYSVRARNSLNFG